MSRRPFGDLAERLYGIDPKAVEDAWVQQYIRIAGIVDLDEMRIDSECLRVINRRQAWQFHLLPLNRQEPELQMATCPERLVRALNFTTRSIDEPVQLLLAEHKQLREFLMKHYPVPQYIARYAEQL
jgi:hypothetical protein